MYPRLLFGSPPWSLCMGILSPQEAHPRSFGWRRTFYTLRPPPRRAQAGRRRFFGRRETLCWPRRHSGRQMQAGHHSILTTRGATYGHHQPAARLQAASRRLFGKLGTLNAPHRPPPLSAGQGDQEICDVPPNSRLYEGHRRLSVKVRMLQIKLWRRFRGEGRSRGLSFDELDNLSVRVATGFKALVPYRFRQIARRKV